MLRLLKPARVHELGSGSSSHVISLATQRNAAEGRPAQHTIFDPFPYAAGGPMGPVSTAAVRPLRAEDIDAEAFAAELQEGDVLFVDTTHTVRTGGDVTHIFLHILPRLAKGVTIHVHGHGAPRSAAPADPVLRPGTGHAGGAVDAHRALRSPARLSERAPRRGCSRRSPGSTHRA